MKTTSSSILAFTALFTVTAHATASPDAHTPRVVIEKRTTVAGENGHANGLHALSVRMRSHTEIHNGPLPGTRIEQTRKVIVTRRVIKADGPQREIVETTEPTTTPLPLGRNSPAYGRRVERLKELVSRVGPEASPSPIAVAGFTDQPQAIRNFVQAVSPNGTARVRMVDVDVDVVHTAPSRRVAPQDRVYVIEWHDSGYRVALVSPEGEALALGNRINDTGNRAESRVAWHGAPPAGPQPVALSREGYANRIKTIASLVEERSGAASSPFSMAPFKEQPQALREFARSVSPNGIPYIRMVDVDVAADHSDTSRRVAPQDRVYTVEWYDTTMGRSIALLDFEGKVVSVPGNRLLPVGTQWANASR